MNKPVLVLGGTGHYGQYIVRNLMGKGATVRVLSRKTDRARRVLGDGPEIIEGDITTRESIVEALKGVGAVIISVSAFSPKSIRKFRQIERDAVLSVLEEMKSESISRIVYVSIYDIKLELPGSFDFKFRKEIARIKLEVEDALKASGLNWTVLGAPPSMEMFFRMIRGDTMVVPGGGPRALPTVSPLDAGEIAAQAVQREDLSGKRFRLVGPEAVSFRQAAKRIGRVRGKTIKFRKIPLLLPKIVRLITFPFTPFSDRIYLINLMTGFIQILNQFPQELADEVPSDYRRLLDTFDYAPTTLEMEAQRRLESGV
jgi:uncharacterized protein YbjT (DUF2867 family)